MENNLKNIDFFIRLAVLGLLFAWCFILLRPFIPVILWGAILAIALFPLFIKVKALIGGRSKLAATIITLIGIGIIVGPVSVLTTAFVNNAGGLADSIANGTLYIPAPPESVSNWPIIGKPLHSIWQQASVNLGTVLDKFQPQLQELAKNLVFVAANTSLILLQFLFSIIIAGVLMPNEAGLKQRVTQVLVKLTPSKGEDFLKLAAATIRNVTRGIIGVALLQTLLIGIGLTVAGIPAAGLLAFICLIFSIIQIGPGIVIIPTIIFAWSTMGTLGALLFTIWMIPCLTLDNIFRPILMAQGLPVPMVVILVGVLGGTLVHGILGLFIGPVILSLGYEIIREWINDAPATQLVIEGVKPEDVDN